MAQKVGQTVGLVLAIRAAKRLHGHRGRHAGDRVSKEGNAAAARN